MVREGILKAGAWCGLSETEEADGDAALMSASVSSASCRSTNDIFERGSRLRCP